MPENFQVLSDGTFRFFIETEGVQRPCSIDVLLLRLACEECEDTHRLPEVDGRLKPTTAFLTDLVGRLTALGVTDCSASIAYQLWIASGEQLGALQKKTNGTQNSPIGSESSPEEPGEMAG